MTDAERAALRDEIEGLTIRQAKARAEVATETLAILTEIGLGGVGPQPIAAPMKGPNPAPALAACPVCARGIGTATSFAECALGVECPAVGGRTTNKPQLVHTLAGPTGTAVVGDRATLLQQPAFDAQGEPIA